MDDKAIEAQIESLVDKSCLQQVLVAIGQVCLDKADRIRTNRQDGALADAWLSAASKIGKLAKNVKL